MKLQELFSVKDKVAIVTGGSRGLGKAIAMGLVEAGAHVVIAARKVEKLQATANELSQLGHPVIPIKCDMASETDIKTLVDTTVQTFGRIDILVNNAGITWGAPTFEFPQDKWDKIMAVNVRGVWILTQQVGNMMKKQMGGKIIMIASIMGMRGADEANQPAIAYNASKAAILNLTRDLAVKWAPNHIQVNAIAPGLFATDMMKWLETMPEIKRAALTRIPLNRMGETDDIKGLAVFLASPASNYMTGAIVTVDGGYTAK